MTQQEIATRIVGFVRDRFSVADSDPEFGVSVPLFEYGYVDSVGLVELLNYLDEEFEVEIPDSDLMSDDFQTIEGMAAVVCRIRNGNG